MVMKSKYFLSAFIYLLSMPFYSLYFPEVIIFVVIPLVFVGPTYRLWFSHDLTKSRDCSIGYFALI